MDFADHIQVLSKKIASIKDMISTEEATKNSMIMPLIQILGYNVFDPTEVTPELVADIGTKKGEKVDYAILKDGKPIVLFECKKAGGDLNINHASQLFRYFHVTEARFAILTNGLMYRFFTDLEKPNKMDEKPFFEFNILEYRPRDLEELKKFAKTSFDVDTILATANELKYTRAIQAQLAEWMASPSEEFVRLVSAGLIENRRFTASVKDQFTVITKRAFEQLVAERINERLKGAMTSADMPVSVAAAPAAAPQTAAPTESAPLAAPELTTNDFEIEAFYTIRAILRSLVPAKRVVMRDAQSYCAILLDDNNRRPICRLHFNNPQKLSVTFFDQKRDMEKLSIESVDELHDHADKLRAAVTAYIGESAQPSA